MLEVFYTVEQKALILQAFQDFKHPSLIPKQVLKYSLELQFSSI